MTTLLLAITESSLLSLVIYIVVMAIIFGLLWWLLDYVGKTFSSAAPFIPIGKIILAIVGVIFLINLLLGLVGTPFIKL